MVDIREIDELAKSGRQDVLSVSLDVDLTGTPLLAQRCGDGPPDHAGPGDQPPDHRRPA